MKKDNRTTIFTKKELQNLPVTYRLMNVLETKEIGELYTRTVFTESTKHFSKSFKKYISDKPISNFILE